MAGNLGRNLLPGINDYGPLAAAADGELATARSVTTNQPFGTTAPLLPKH